MSASEGPHVLTVDDSPVDRKLIEMLLKRSSYRVFVAVTAVDSAVRALEFLGLGEEGHASSFNVSEVDMIITDYCMPEMTGFDLLKRLKSSALKDIPIVVVSSENVPDRISRCMKEGAEDFLLKPLKLSDVTQLGNRMMKKKGNSMREDPHPHEKE